MGCWCISDDKAVKNKQAAATKKKVWKYLISERNVKFYLHLAKRIINKFKTLVS